MAAVPHSRATKSVPMKDGRIFEHSPSLGSEAQILFMKQQEAGERRIKRRTGDTLRSH